jgi:hypothetical protein
MGHLDRIAAIEAAAARYPGLVLAGSVYRGSGIPDCVQSGEQAAERLLDPEGIDWTRRDLGHGAQHANRLS